MTAACRRIGTLVTRIQEAYLHRPGLTLTLEQAEARFRLDPVTCRALLDLFLEAGVLTRTGGAYRLRQPGRSPARRAGGARLEVAA